jgi:hypothetical protein
MAMHKQTSDRVSSAASHLLKWAEDPNDLDDETLANIKTVAASALAQDEIPGAAGIHPAPVEFSEAQVTLDPVLHFFHYSHLPEKLRHTSRAFFLLAAHVINTVPRNPERTVALRKLLEAKDAAVRANLPPRETKDRPAVASEQSLGEARETGGHDEDRDGPVPFDV